PAGNRIYSPKNLPPGLVPDVFSCRKCLPCRLNNAKEKAIRCWHESKMHDDNIFLTLTYSDEHLESPRLIYSHWQEFIHKLRDKIRYNSLGEQKISTMVTGEYGEQTKRPHWHALIFNYRPGDERPYRTTERGDKVYRSETIQTLWNKGYIEYGDVTIDSANYVARYAAKKLVHGIDQAHDYHPIHRTSSKHAIGKRWIEKYYKQTFEHGYVLLPNFQKAKIPRYYCEWVEKHHPAIWERYVTQIRPRLQEQAEAAERAEEMIFLTNLINKSCGAPHPMKRSQVKETILKAKFKQLQERLKL
ncbi:replication initiator protein, partial [Apis mellifera associated microvirus 24]